MSSISPRRRRQSRRSPNELLITGVQTNLIDLVRSALNSGATNLDDALLLAGMRNHRDIMILIWGDGNNFLDADIMQSILDRGLQLLTNLDLEPEVRQTLLSIIRNTLRLQERLDPDEVDFDFEFDMLTNAMSGPTRRDLLDRTLNALYVARLLNAGLIVRVATMYDNIHLVTRFIGYVNDIEELESILEIARNNQNEHIVTLLLNRIRQIMGIGASINRIGAPAA
jgi:hypothetical protein